MIKKIYIVVLASLFFLPLCVQAQKHSFEIKGGEFVYDGKAIRIISGEMHYPRIPHQYWRHRMQMLKAMGLNAVATYVFWNAHEPEPGKWDFTGDNNLADYIKIAGEEGLMVILRPGPYVCAEWEFGGYPWWLQNVKDLELRRDNEQFLKYTRLYINRLYQEVGNLQITKGGPIIMVQAENEFGSYVSQRKDIPLAEHRAYNAKIVQQLKDAGFEVPMFTSDGSWLFEGGATPGALPTANGESNIENLKKVVNEYNGGQGPYMVAEFYPGWLDHWAEPFPLVGAGRIARQTEKYLQNDVSINYYMVHGGTNFGFTSGANYDKNHDIQPDMTSYDYDAPISEAGWVTPKYDSIRNVIKKYVKYPLPEAPAAIPVIEIPPVKLTKIADMMEVIGAQKPLQNDKPLTFEQMNQGHGYVLYKRHFTQPISGKLDIEGLRDYALVYVNGVKAGELNRYFKNYTMEIDIPFNSTLEILVENMGRINYGANIIHNTKGIISPVKINDNVIEGEWEMYQAPMDKTPVLERMDKSQVYDLNKAAHLKGKPVVYKGVFDLTKTGDAFLDMEDWGKGIVFVNGKNIGRYWNVGPQHTLYVPGVWLKKGRNEIVIFEQQNDKLQTEVRTTKIPVLTKLKELANVQTAPPEPYGAIPAEKQIDWQKLEYYMFIHFGPNTFTGVEWGDGREDPKVFNPAALDCRQWAETAEAAGMKGIIITAKHHDGFCLFPSKYSTHTVRESLWKDGKGDVLKELSDACREYGLKFGVYLSPWDRNHPAYGTPEYNQIFANTLSEVLSGYGEVFEQWLDGANGEGEGGKKQVYDWNLFYETIYRNQPQIIIFSDVGPDVRWMGNESGIAGATNWSTLNVEGFEPGKNAPPQEALNTGEQGAKAWIPAEVDVSIRPGWFYSPSTDTMVKSVAELMDIYYTSIGRNSNLLLNVPPDRRGRIHPNDSTRLIEFRKAREEAFAENLIAGATIKASNTRGNSAEYKPGNVLDADFDTYWTTDDNESAPYIEINLKKAETFNRLLLQEYIPLGQRVSSFSVKYWDKKIQKWTEAINATTIGYKRILRFPAVTAQKLRIEFKALTCPLISDVGIYQSLEY